ncbi:hypothetical protein WUBG_01941, partial [Wuchereria bancrofti]
VLTNDHLNEYRKQFFIGSKSNWTICSGDDLNVQSPVKEFWNYQVLGISSGIEEPGGLRWDLAFFLLIVWTICYLCIFKGVRWTGKIVYLTASFPYIMLICLLIRGLTLPGANLGLEFYLKPNFEKLFESKVWVDAVTQVFFSYGLGLGALVALGSYNSYHNNIYRQALTICFVNSATSVFAGFVIFSFIGFMAVEQGKPVDEVAQSGPGLLFLAYPSGILQLPYTNVCFVRWKAFFTAVIDEFPHLIHGKKYGREFFVLGICIISYLCGLSTVTKGGFYVFQLFDFLCSIRLGASMASILRMYRHFLVCWYIKSSNFLSKLNRRAILSLSKMIKVSRLNLSKLSFLLGIDQWYEYIKSMVGYYPSRWWKFCWVFATPVVCMSVMIFGLAKYEPLRIDAYNYDYPLWGHIFGWFLSLSSMLCIPVYGVYLWTITDGTTSQRVEKLFRPKIQIELDGNVGQELTEREE